MVAYERDMASKTHCGRIGCDVARRRFKKNFPEGYKRMMLEKNLFDGISIITLILFERQQKNNQ